MILIYSSVSWANEQEWKTPLLETEEIPGENQFIYLPLWEKTAKKKRWKRPSYVYWTDIRYDWAVHLFHLEDFLSFFLSFPFCHNLSIRDGGNKWPYSSLHRLEIQYKLISSLALPMLTLSSSSTDSIFHFKTIRSFSWVLTAFFSSLSLLFALSLRCRFVQTIGKERNDRTFPLMISFTTCSLHRQIVDDDKNGLIRCMIMKKNQIECVAYAPMA